jgi:hypothetical protein
MNSISGENMTVVIKMSIITLISNSSDDVDVSPLQYITVDALITATHRSHRGGGDSKTLIMMMRRIKLMIMVVVMMMMMMKMMMMMMMMHRYQ